MLMDLTKAILIAASIGVVVKGDISLLPFAIGAIIISAHLAFLAWFIHPEAEVDKEIKIWKAWH